MLMNKTSVTQEAYLSRSHGDHWDNRCHYVQYSRGSKLSHVGRFTYCQCSAGYGIWICGHCEYVSIVINSKYTKKSSGLLCMDHGVVFEIQQGAHKAYWFLHMLQYASPPLICSTCVPRAAFCYAACLLVFNTVALEEIFSLEHLCCFYFLPPAPHIKYCCFPSCKCHGSCDAWS